MEKKNPQKAALNEFEQQKINYAYSVLDAYIEAFNKVASAKPEEKQRLYNRLQIESMKKLSKLYGALTILVQQEHQPILYSFFNAQVNMVESLSESKKEK